MSDGASIHGGDAEMAGMAGFGGFGAARVADLVRQPALVVTAGDRFVAAGLDPAEWH